MRINELRIGNYVFSSEVEVSKVIELTQRKVAVATLGDNFAITVKYFEVDSIPLTEEWLRRTHLKGRADFIYYNDLGINTRESKYYVCIRDRGGVIFHTTKEIKFVHELQNWYFCVEGEELEFKEL